MDRLIQTATNEQCFHCGEPVKINTYKLDEHLFCCLGCQHVYSLLNNHKLTDYYRYNQHPGKQVWTKNDDTYLTDPVIADSLLDFKDTQISIVTFYIPHIHCSSCIWLLEHLHQLEDAICSSRVDFLKKQVRIVYRHDTCTLYKLTTLLTRIGYAPHISFHDTENNTQTTQNKQNRLIGQIAVAGFCFGNAMMASFPEYFGMGNFEKQYATLFGWLNLAFALPCMGYSGREYFISSIKSLRRFRLNLDVPLALGIWILFVRSVVDIVQRTGPGFSDTLCGLVFFLLLGKWVQQKTYHHLSFERDYKSYFPVAVTKIIDGKESTVALADLHVGDRILIRNNEIVPADAILLKGDACIDFSFVTGESTPVSKVLGELVYAGGKQIEQAIELEVVKPVSQSYLTSLWNTEQNQERLERFSSFSHTVSRYFTPVLLTIALISTAVWAMLSFDDRAWGAFTSVLIIGCPCALALSSPFTLSAVLSIFDKHGLFLKNTLAVEKMAAINTLVFDKTGTISTIYTEGMTFTGDLTQTEQGYVYAVCRNSNHPQSREIARILNGAAVTNALLTAYEELPGAGIKAQINGVAIRVGNARFVGMTNIQHPSSGTHVQINGVFKGSFMVQQRWRNQLGTVIQHLEKEYFLHLLSGDTDKDRDALRKIFPEKTPLYFNQLPTDKWNYIRKCRRKGFRVAMFGDGLNDAAALKEADLGIAISDDVNNFSPACDGILSGEKFALLPSYLNLARQAMKVIRISFGISLAYNLVGLFFAVQGTMSPLFAAVLMPLSTVTIVTFTRVATLFCAYKNNL